LDRQVYALNLAWHPFNDRSLVLLGVPIFQGAWRCKVHTILLPLKLDKRQAIKNEGMQSHYGTK